jgi:hypothetical protein
MFDDELCTSPSPGGGGSSTSRKTVACARASYRSDPGRFSGASVTRPLRPSSTMQEKKIRVGASREDFLFVIHG